MYKYEKKKRKKKKKTPKKQDLFFLPMFRLLNVEPLSRRLNMCCNFWILFKLNPIFVKWNEKDEQFLNILSHSVIIYWFQRFHDILVYLI